MTCSNEQAFTPHAATRAKGALTLPEDSVFAAFWGKARPSPAEGAGMHPLVAHCLDVAAVAVLLPGRTTGLDGRTLGWLVALHDIGKFSRPFQAMAPRHWPAPVLGPLDAAPVPPGPRHDAVALLLLQGAVADLADPVLPPSGWLPSERAVLFRAIAGHHGRPVAAPRPDPAVTGPACEAAARAFVLAMAELFRPPPLPSPADPRALARLEWALAGITTLADWIGSRRSWFPYAPPDAVADPAAYFHTRALPQAAFALAAAGLTGAGPARFEGWQRLFPTVAAPSPVQRWAAEVAFPAGPVLAVVEDLTGSGKTEAAVMLAHRLLASGRAGGIYMALPTTATATAMFGRMAKAYRRLFDDGTDPSLALVHGRAGLGTGFAPALDGGEPSPSSRAAADPADEPAEAHCSAWLAEDRRRALMAQMGVGTIDQALMAVLPVRHATLRLQGLRGKVLVVDEAHAFDPYMKQELAALLEFHAALGGSAILLSATLPRRTRQELVDAFRRGLGAPRAVLASTDYPLATLSGAGEVEEHPCAPRDRLPRTVMVTRVADLGQALFRVATAVRAGAAVAWVRNTVDDVLAAAALLRADGIEPLVFHARFAFGDRLDIEAEVLRRFGRDAVERSGVLVASQVVESSLDLDFDLMCTDLAPVDLVIQRAGRLWRHERARVLDRPELLVLSPDPVSAPGPGWIRDLLPGTAAVYPDPALLWRSARALFAAGSLRTPEDMRPMVEAAAEGEIPPGLAAQSGRAEGMATSAGGVGRQNVLKFMKGYRPEAGDWEPDTHTPTRLEDRPQATLRLARLEGGRIVPYVAGSGALRRDWSLSEVVVAQHRLANCPLPTELAEAAAAAKAEWGRWEWESPRFVLALLRLAEDGETYSLAGQSGAGTPVSACYHRRLGLCWSPA